MTRKVNLTDVVGPIDAADSGGKLRARTALGLEKVDNISDADKPVSAAVQSALAGKASVNHTHDFSGIFSTLNTLGETEQCNVRIALGAPARHFATIDALKASKFAWPKAALLTAGNAAYLYRVADSSAVDHQLVTVGGVKLYVVGDRVTPDQFGADPTGKNDSTEAFNAAMRYCVTAQKIGYSSGTYKMTGTLAPGGYYRWEWGSTRLNFFGVTADNLTNVMENPSASGASYVDSGKGVCFDMKGCAASINSGLVRIQVSSPGNMKLASRASIPSNVVALTASEGSCRDAQWDQIHIIGADYGLFQGNMSGSAPNILPYTGWRISYLQIQFCRIPFQGGDQGDGFDDLYITALRLMRNGGPSEFKTSVISGGTAFIEGVILDGDEESQTLSTTAGNSTVILSADNSLIKAGTTLVIEDAGVNKSGKAIEHVAKVVTKSGTTLTLDLAPDRTVSGATFSCDPPSILLSVAGWIFDTTFWEEHFEFPIKLQNRSTIKGDLKCSLNDISGKYGSVVHLNFGSQAIGTLHEHAANNDEIKSFVAVGSQRNGTEFCRNKVDLHVPEEYASGRTDSDVCRVVDYVSGEGSRSYYPNGSAASITVPASNYHNPNLSLIARFVDRTAVYQAHNVDNFGRVAFTLEPDGTVRTGVPALITAATAGGNHSGPSGGASNKTTGAIGYLEHVVTAKTRFRISIGFSSFTSGRPRLVWRKGNSDLYEETSIAPTLGKVVIYADAPADATAIRLVGGSTDIYGIDEFTVAKVLSF
jgi:hypothetical protein